jgi:hypothetical protein
MLDPSGKRRRIALKARRQSRIPGAEEAGVAERGLGELDASRMGMGARADIGPIEEVLTEGRIPVGRLGRERQRLKTLGCRMGVRVESCPVIIPVTGPPANRNLLRVHGVAHDEITRRRISREAGEEAYRQIERSPPCVYRRRAPPICGSELREDERGLRGSSEIQGNGIGVITRVFVVLIEGRVPRYFLGLRINLNRADEVTDRGENLPSDGTDRTIRHQRHVADSPTARLHDHLMSAQIDHRHERALAVRSRQGFCLPTSSGQTERCMLELRLGRCDCHGKLAEKLRVGMERVARLMPLLVGKSRPP